ncbi:MAG TPA: ATP-binding cassette domain-containing protein, partial [Victivallales bacterium]|nr:ATP-binding cassette domain-containing protein [Victivallales bacterium]
WDKNCSATKVEHASKHASAISFINELQYRYNTLLGDNGINISGGQRQRISIAREIYKNAPILLLDEATSALDSETEQMIQDNLRQIHGTKTILVIAHRLSTIKDCDKIFVLDSGKVVEEGSYAELYQKCGKFRQMVERQSL